MISRKKFLVWSVVLVVVTAMFTYGVSNLVGLYLPGGKVIISQSNYNALMGIYNRYSKVEALRANIDNFYLEDVDDLALEDGMLKGLMSALNDPYSVYMTKKEFADYTAQSKGSYGGIGIYVSAGEDGLITVVSPIEGSPAYRAGIVTGDKIIGVNGQGVTGERLDAATSLMKGEAGTEVTITIIRENVKDPIEVKLKREIIVIKSVKHDIISNNIGYIRISTFDEKTHAEFMESYNALRKNKDVKGLIIDLRNNPGGYLNQTVAIADELLGEGLIVYTEDKNGVREEEKSGGKAIDMPVVVLVNGGSASASEILAGALKDHDVATIIGTKTFGKGLVQRFQDFKDGSGFRITISRYYTPSGEYIHKKGIEPHIMIELPDEFKDKGVIPEELENDTQLQRALQEIRTKIR